MNTQKTAIIRDRGQLTIPDSIRNTADWTKPLSAVTISLVKPDEIVIKPHQQVNWSRVWEGIKKARAIKGKGQGNLSKFIAEDRHRH